MNNQKLNLPKDSATYNNIMNTEQELMINTFKEKGIVNIIYEMASIDKTDLLNEIKDRIIYSIDEDDISRIFIKKSDKCNILYGRKNKTALFGRYYNVYENDDETEITVDTLITHSHQLQNNNGKIKTLIKRGYIENKPHYKKPYIKRIF